MRMTHSIYKLKSILTLVVAVSWEQMKDAVNQSVHSDTYKCIWLDFEGTLNLLTIIYPVRQLLLLLLLQMATRKNRSMGSSLMGMEEWEKGLKWLYEWY